MSIRTERLVLRPLKLSDAARIALLAGDFDVASMTGTIPHPYSEQMAGEWIGSALQGEEGTVFVIELDGTLIGCVGYREDEKGGAELGYWLGKPYWGQGYATEASAAMVAYAFDDRRPRLSHQRAFRRQSSVGADHHQARLQAARRDQPRLRGAGREGAVFHLPAGAGSFPLRSVILSAPVLEPSPCSFSIRPRFLCARATAARAASRFRREKFVEFGGPDGGDGGKGGDVVLECVANLNTLLDYRYQQHFKAKKGEHGKGQNRSGAGGADVVLKLPPGTQVFAEDGETLIADLTEPGQRIVLLHGGNGGFGNAKFKSSTNQAPRHANPGQVAEEMYIWLRLKLIADAGLVGLPNAGKSTFLAAVSAAKPKIADYPFTTLHPNLGVVRVDTTDFVLADIPGLIEGAHEGAGLGDRFLGHVERTAVLLHLVDATQDDPAEAYEIIRGEIEAYGAGLEDKPEIVALSKADAVPEKEMAKKAKAVAKVAGVKPLVLSAVSGQGMQDALRQLAKEVVRSRSKGKEPKREVAGWRP